MLSLLNNLSPEKGIEGLLLPEVLPIIGVVNITAPR